MKVSNVVAAQKAIKIAPDLEEAIEEDDDGDMLVEDQVNADDDESADLLKDKYIKKPKSLKSNTARKATTKKGKKDTKDLEDFDDMSEEEPKSSNARARKTKGSGIQARAKK
jgi:replication factor C subunit 1